MMVINLEKPVLNLQLQVLFNIITAFSTGQFQAIISFSIYILRVPDLLTSVLYKNMYMCIYLKNKRAVFLFSRPDLLDDAYASAIPVFLVNTVQNSEKYHHHNC